MLERVKRFWLPLLAAAIACVVVLPRLIDRAAAPPMAVTDAPRLAVRDPSGATIGWLNIRYPRTIRENEEGVLEAEYTTGSVQWAGGSTPGGAYGAVRPPAGMKVELSGADLVLAPSPNHQFDVARIAATGRERVKWIVSP
jgi:hypothetical protein